MPPFAAPHAVNGAFTAHSVAVHPAQPLVDLVEGLLRVLLAEQQLGDLRVDDVLGLALGERVLAWVEGVRRGDDLVYARDAGRTRHPDHRGHLADLVGP